MKWKLALPLAAMLVATVVTVSAQQQPVAKGGGQTDPSAVPPPPAGKRDTGDDPDAAVAAVPGPAPAPAPINELSSPVQRKSGDSPFEQLPIPLPSPRGVEGPDDEIVSRAKADSPRGYSRKHNPSLEPLIQRLGAAKSEGEREQLKAQVSAMLGQQFDERMARQEQELQALEQQVRRLRSLIDKRKENRREIIARRFEQIVRDSQGLGW